MLKTLCDFLDKKKVEYKTIQHAKSETAQETAASAHIQGNEFAKTVVFKRDGIMALAVLPAPEKIDDGLLASACDANQVELATEEEFRDLFPQCETGAMPPVGSLFDDLDVYLEEEMTMNDNITFNAGTHTELIQMKMKDYLSLVNPEIVRISSAYTE